MCYECVRGLSGVCQKCVTSVLEACQEYVRSVLEVLVPSKFKEYNVKLQYLFRN